MIDELLLASVDVVLQADELLLETLQLAEVVSIVALQVLDFLEHHELLFVDDVLLGHILAIESIKAHLVAKGLALHLALLLLLLELIIQGVHAALHGIDVLRDIFGLQALLTHVIARHDYAFLDLLALSLLELKIGDLLVGGGALLFLHRLFLLLGAAFFTIFSLGTLFAGLLLRCLSLFSFLFFGLGGSLINILLALLHVRLELLRVFLLLPLERLNVLRGTLVLMTNLTEDLSDHLETVDLLDVINLTGQVLVRHLLDLVLLVRSVRIVVDAATVR